MKMYDKHIGLAIAVVASNVWLLIDDEGRRFLVDSGFRPERTALMLGLWRAGVRRPGDLTAVLLTHRHSDHAGNAGWLRERFRCPVLCHENDAPYLSGEKRPGPLKRGFGNFYDEFCCRVEDNHPVRLRVDETFGTGTWRYGFTIFPAFGHTEGSVLIHHEPTGTLFSGDALLSGFPPLRITEHFWLAVPAYSVDAAQCRRHVIHFLRDPPPLRRLCSGHGPFIGRQTADKLRNFVCRYL